VVLNAITVPLQGRIANQRYENDTLEDCINGMAILPLVPLHATEEWLYTGLVTTSMF
jgi:hypothetical protein